jgi:hypothetical protein
MERDSGDPLALIARCAQAVRDLGEPGAEIVADYLAEMPAELFARIADADNRPGRSARLAAVIEQRNVILRRLGCGVPPVELASEMAHFGSSGDWQRNQHAASCPWPAGDRRADWWAVLKLRNVLLGPRQLAKIIKVS